MQPEKQPTQQEQQPIEKSNQHINLTRFDNVPTSSGQGREILLIQQSIQTNIEGFLRDFLGMQYMSALTPIYNHRVPEFKETQIEFDPIL